MSATERQETLINTKNMEKSTDTENTGAAQSLPHSDLLDILLSIQGNAESLPCGGIGSDGATQAELDEANELGRPFENDAVYHTGQQIWLEAQRGIILLSNAEDRNPAIERTKDYG